MRHSEGQYGELRRSGELEHVNSGKCGGVSVVQSSGAVRYRVDSVYCLANKAGNGLKHE